MVYLILPWKIGIGILTKNFYHHEHKQNQDKIG